MHEPAPTLGVYGYNDRGDVLTVAIEQAEIMDIPLKDLGLDGFDPDMLLKPPKAT